MEPPPARVESPPPTPQILVQQDRPLSPPAPAAFQTARDRAPHTSRTTTAPAPPPEQAARHTGASCQRSSSKFLQTRGCRTGTPAEIPAAELRAATAPDPRLPVAASPNVAPARSRPAAAPPQSTIASRVPAAER